MEVRKKGKYRFLKDWVNRGSLSIGTIPKGTIVEITQIDERVHKVISSDFADWMYWDLPVEPVVQDGPKEGMKKEEYHRREDAIQQKYLDKLNALKKEYMMANKKYSIGDVIESYSYIIEVDNITVSNMFIYPTAVYHGQVLNKDLTPSKKGTRFFIVENNVTKHHKRVVKS